jgi:hypothetical protein
MEPIYLFLIIIFVPLIVFFNIITFIMINCNPDPVRLAPGDIYTVTDANRTLTKHNEW